VLSLSLPHRTLFIRIRRSLLTLASMLLFTEKITNKRVSIVIAVKRVLL